MVSVYYWLGLGRGASLQVHIVTKDHRKIAAVHAYLIVCGLLSFVCDYWWILLQPNNPQRAENLENSSEYNSSVIVVYLASFLIAFNSIPTEAHPRRLAHHGLYLSMAVEQHLLDLTALVLSNLTDQHDWTEVQLHDDGRPRPRPVITGLPPTRLYIHPDEQIEILEKEQVTGKRPSQAPEFEWVLPVHLSEQWTLSSFATIFDSIDALPRMAHSANISDAASGRDWRGAGRRKRLLLAVVHDDSTVSYYLMHEGIVKPRQN